MIIIFSPYDYNTGWVDVDLSDRGRIEIQHAARLMLERGYTVDVTYTSMLKRAIRSSWIILKELNQIYRYVSPHMIILFSLYNYNILSICL